MADPDVNWSTRTILPDGFLPMLPAAAPGPLDSPDHAYEIRWDGQRALVGLEGARLLARAPSGQDCAPWFPELSAVRAAVEPVWALLDAEWVVPAGDRAAPEPLRARLRQTAPMAVARAAAEHPAVLVVADILRIGDSWLLDVPWAERRDILLRAVRPSPRVRLARAFAVGEAAASEAVRLAQGSVLAKRRRGRYLPGVRSRDWLAIRPADEVEALVCGHAPGEEGGLIVLLAEARGDRLTYAGRAVGPHAPEVVAAVRSLPSAATAVSAPRAASLPAGVTWVHPCLACRVAHQGRTGAGLLRHAEIRALLGAGVEVGPPG